MPGVSKEQIVRAKEIGIEEYVLAHEPNNIKKIGNALYLRDHDSLEISNGLWNWHSHGIGGKNVIDYLIKVRGYSFVDAVLHLAGGKVRDYSTAQNAKPPPEHKQFILPPRNADNRRAIAYLQEVASLQSVRLHQERKGHFEARDRAHREHQGRRFQRRRRFLD
ncbi:hypothetical protein FACS18949_05290 [Clostridia bacterium]|nr:hypothetical protein FACS18949_05290 [Clostridia bacterium]